MDTIPLNAVWAATAVTSGTAVVAPVADIAGAAADMLLMRGLLLSLIPWLILLLLRLVRGLLLSLMPQLMLRLSLIWWATFIVALAASAAIAASTPAAPPAASGFEASGQGMVAVGPVLAPVEPSTQTRPPASSVRLKSGFKAKFLFSGAYEGGRPFKTRRLISCSDTSIS